MTTYSGYDVLEIQPNAVTQWGTSVTRPTIGTANPNGNVVITTTTALPKGARSLTWNCESRTDLLALTDWLDARRGQLVECWVPTYQRDLEVVAVVPFSGTHVKANPASDLFATNRAWSFWIARTVRGVTWGTSYWNQSVDNGDGTHTWNTSPGAGPTNVGNIVDPFSVTTANGFTHSRLVFSRMASDSYTVRYLARAATVTADFVEVVPPP